MPRTPSTLGTLLRHLLVLLDGDLEKLYVENGLRYRPRYTPIVRALLVLQSASIRQISDQAGMTHSAVSQTVAQMKRDGLVVAGRGPDGRESIVIASAALMAMLPEIERHWHATDAAAAQLDEELSAPLSCIAAEAIAALDRHPFRARIREHFR